MTRRCAGIALDDGSTRACGTDISDLHHQAQRCDPCKKDHKRLQRNRHQRNYHRSKVTKAKSVKLAELAGIEQRLRRELGEAMAEMRDTIERHDQLLLDLMSELNDLRDPPRRWALLVEAWGKGTQLRKRQRQLQSGRT